MDEKPWDLATYQRAYEVLMDTAKRLTDLADRIRPENEKLESKTETWTEAEQLEFYRQVYFEYLQLWGKTGREVIRLASVGRWFDLLEMVGDGLNARDAVDDETVAAYDIAVQKAKAAEAKATQ